jgi:hypothetical protein
MSLTIQQAIINFKTLIEAAIIARGQAGFTSSIRSSAPILNIHEAVKQEFIRNRIASTRLRPPLTARVPELKLAGELKQKNQDVCVLPDALTPIPEVLIGGLLDGTKDPFGKIYTEKTIAINIRSQISSLAKNFDTLFERTFSEALNLHERCPLMCLGEVYMIAVPEYDQTQFAHNRIAFKRMDPRTVEYYIKSFNAINNRSITSKDFYQYEKVCLLVVDFSQNPPKLYDTDADLKRDGLLPATSAVSIAPLTWNSFVSSLLTTYNLRFHAVPPPPIVII